VKQQRPPSPLVSMRLGSGTSLHRVSAAAGPFARARERVVGVVSAPHPAAPHTTCSPTPTAPTDAACVS
jgi:hypothetical protein